MGVTGRSQMAVVRHGKSFRPQRRNKWQAPCVPSAVVTSRQEGTPVAAVLGGGLTAAASSALPLCGAARASVLRETALPLLPSGSYRCDSPIGPQGTERPWVRRRRTEALANGGLRLAGTEGRRGPG